MEKEYFAEIIINGKTINISAYEKRYDSEGEMYYARFDGFNGKQKKRCRDWASRQPESIKTAVLSVIGKGKE